ncbi:MAG: hypothetical protein M0Z34_12120 [Nitrospiraceae bacterium]|nr:hypothetical protein [Nitrospiraceae bacterium]
MSLRSTMINRDVRGRLMDTYLTTRLATGDDESAIVTRETPLQATSRSK